MNIVIELSEEEAHKKRFKPSLMEMRVFNPRRAKIFSSAKDYKRNPKHKNKNFDE